eukprot:1184252-Prorocentrum_minimum.AAC.3
MPCPSFARVSCTGGGVQVGASGTACTLRAWWGPGDCGTPCDNGASFPCARKQHCSIGSRRRGAGGHS